MGGNAHLILRRLAGSDLGWFGAARRQDRAKGRQRGININAVIMQALFPEVLLATGFIPVISRRLADGETQRRPIRRQEKNWRLVGDKVEGEGLEQVAEGDFFWAEIVIDERPPFQLTWDVVTAAGHRDLHLRIAREFAVHLDGAMGCWDASDLVGDHLATILGLRQREQLPAPQSPDDSGRTGAPRVVKPGAQHPMPSRPMPDRAHAPSRKRRRIDARLERPHILTEIVRSGLSLSSINQADFLDVLDELSAQLRRLLLEEGAILRAEIGHATFWPRVRGKRIGFVDAGVANVSALGAAPLAIRVGSYTVTPGKPDPAREEFGFEAQLVDELFEPADTTRGLFDNVFDDTAKLRDAARICCELSGVVSLAGRKPLPDVVLLHGPLVNPVSPYALGHPGDPDAFPNFTAQALRKLLADDRPRTGRDANFVSVYRDQLLTLASGPVTVCGVVERSSATGPGPLMRLLTERLRDDNAIDNVTAASYERFFRSYRFTDSLMFECVLEEGEYLAPVEVHRQGPDNKIPTVWALEIQAFPRPLVTYVKSSADAMPIRVESFGNGGMSHADLVQLIIHTSRLLPRYSFPVGLDIVDRHAKVPEWMSRQMNVILQAQLMRRAMDTGNASVIRMARRILSANTRDWLFRPDIRRP